jgi:hypothetical protein
MNAPRASRILWAVALAFAFALSICAVLRGGYIGLDYQTHLSRLIERFRIHNDTIVEVPF